MRKLSIELIINVIKKKKENVNQHGCVTTKTSPNTSFEPISTQYSKFLVDRTESLAGLKPRYEENLVSNERQQKQSVLRDLSECHCAKIDKSSRDFANL